MESFVNKLKDSGYKLTPQRLAVAKYMDGNKNHPTAIAIYTDLKLQYPSMSIATIYNTLNMMTALGMLSELKLHKDQANYDSDLSHHHHFCCQKCHAIIDIHELKDIPETENFIKNTNHQVDHVCMIFKGICENCLGTE